MKNLIVLAVAGLLATGCASTASNDEMASAPNAPAVVAENPAPAETSADVDDDATPGMRRVCTSERVTGSNRPRRTCRMVPVVEEPAEPAMRRHCTRERVSGSNRQRRTCRMVPVTD
jgi:hypothetical protein